MSTPVGPSLQIAFQGGGARIGALLAAAEGVYKATDGKATLVTLSGTSAGAIAASALASDKPPEHYRQPLKIIGPEFLNKICRTTSPWNPIIYKRLLSGGALYNTIGYREFLTKLFHDTSLRNEIKLILPAVNIHESGLEDSPVQRSQLIDRIVSSSAIPFVFHGWKSDSPFIDGGALNNLPVECLDNGPSVGRKIAITFEEPASGPPRSVLQYLMSLASCVIGYNVKQSSALVETDSVINIPTSLSTFSFQESINFINLPEYNAVRELVRSRVSAIIAEENHAKSAAQRDHLSVERELGILVGDIQRAHTNLTRQSRVRLTERIVEYKCYNLFDKNTLRKDLVTFRDHIISDSQIFAYRSTSSSDDDAIKSGAPAFNVMDANDNSFDAVAIGLPEAIGGAISADYKNMMLFFRAPLPIDKRGYFVTLRGRADEALYDLLNTSKNYDQIGFKCVEADSIDKLYLICQIPESLVSKLTLSDDPSMYGNPVNWREGRRMSVDEIGRTIGKLGLSEDGFARIGWVLDNITRGETAGFRAFFS